jgi:hypothetical protein
MAERGNCPSCDRLVEIDQTDEGSRSYRTLGYKPIGSKPCSVCGAPLCQEMLPDWPITHPVPPRCDLWFEHPGLHRKMFLVPSRQDFIWGEGEATWEHGKLVQTWRFTGYAPNAGQETSCFYDGEGRGWDALDFVPDGYYQGPGPNRLGDWEVTVTFNPKERP